VKEKKPSKLRTSEMNLCDVDFGLGGLETFDLRSLSQPSQIQEYNSASEDQSDGDDSEDDTESDPNFEEGQINEEDDSDDDDDDDVSLIEEEGSTDSEDSDLAGIQVDVNVPQLPLDAIHMDDDGRESRNPFSRMYTQGKCGQGIEMEKSPFLLVTCLWTKNNGVKLLKNM